MADRLAIPKQNLHNLLQLSELPDEVVSAFADPGDIKVRHGMRLAPLLKDERHRDGIVAAAIEIAAEQAALRNAGADRIEGSKVCERLAGAAQPTKAQPARRAKAALTMAGGAQIGQILVDTRAKGITVNINPRGAASIDEILETLRPVLEAAKFTR